MNKDNENDKEQYLKNSIEDFVYQNSPFGYSDLREAINIFIGCGLTSRELYEAKEEFKESCDIKNDNDIDITCIALDYVFQEARNTIERVLNIDIENDYNFYVYGNYMCSSIDYSEESKEELQKAYNESTEEQKQDLRECGFFVYFASCVELKIN